MQKITQEAQETQEAQKVFRRAWKTSLAFISK